MKHLSWIILFPVAVGLIVLSVSNRDAINIDLWPFPIIVAVPLFAVIFTSLLIGVLWGGFSTWLNGAKARRMARVKSREADRAMAENRNLKDRIAALEADARTTARDHQQLAGNPDRELPPPSDAA